MCYLVFLPPKLGHIDEDCITEMAVYMKRSRESTAALVKEVCELSVIIFRMFLGFDHFGF